ncbi:uncharacterized protein PFL1_05112 [Pseudozyma flocculosa PF-1]|uniref:Transcription factor TFIIIC complex subunit Tfc6 n=2 Tax=Pseudozyma flocculosa TaxID=84751 RepID=A0A5C3F5B0_9BASI|nr:uncharacterized protein PFL1_05112 [Pseudozyma flocculosa PF-1]EPQ27189.1 hypothetical protein PFL1_05112 [Pseudozyma flocculosa PF-1]SPO39552.1 uncharacterized protein PSFLO_05033 [Pseudozyma flocculosa]
MPPRRAKAAAAAGEPHQPLPTESNHIDTQPAAVEVTVTPARRSGNSASATDQRQRSQTPLRTPVSALKSSATSSRATPSAARRSFTIAVQDTPGLLSRSQSPAMASADEGSIASTDSPLRRSGRAKKRIRYDLDVPDDQTAEDGDAFVPPHDEDADQYGDGDGDDDADASPFEDLDDDDDAGGNGNSRRRTPAKRTPTARKPRASSTPAKAKAKATPTKAALDDDADDADDRGSLRSYSYLGTNAEHKARWQSTASKQRAYSYSQMWPLYQPPDLQTAESGKAYNLEDNEDEPEQGDQDDARPGITWPQDGLARTRLQAMPSLPHRRFRVQYWSAICGLIPALLLHDMMWWPGKGYGYKEERNRARWAQEKRQSGQHSDEARVGWPFLHPCLDAASVKLLTNDEASAFGPGARTASDSQRHPLAHPIHISGSAAPRADPQTPGKRKKGAGKAVSARTSPDADDADADPASEAESVADEADAEGSGGHKVDIDLADPKFRDLQNLGLMERSQDPSESLRVWLGPHSGQQQVSLLPGTSTRLGNYLEGNEGHILNAGGHVYALDWVPVPIHLDRGKEYVAVSASLSPRPLTFLGAKGPRPMPGRIQIWSVCPDSRAEDGAARKGQAALEMSLCVDSGSAFQLAWCPAGHDYREAASTASGADEVEDGGADEPTAIRRLGLLAGVFEDGTASIFAPPHPDDVRWCHRPQQGSKGKARADEGASMSIKLDPVVRLELKSTAVTALDWAGGERLAVGCANGYIAVYAIGDALRSGNTTGLRPMYYASTHACAITSLSWFMAPPIDADGMLDVLAPPHLIFSVGLDGNVTLSDMLSGSVAVSEHQRHVHGCSAFMPFLQNLANENGESAAAMFGMRPDEAGRQRGIAAVATRVTALGTSAYHPVVAVGSAAGEVKLSNALRASRRSGNVKGHTVRAQTPLYRLATNRKTGELKMHDNLVVEATTTKEDRQDKAYSSPPEIGITAACWNPNIGRALFLATGTGCGLVRLDWAENRLKTKAASATATKTKTAAATEAG